MEKIRCTNLIHLQSAPEEDAIAFETEGLDLKEGELSPFEKYSQKLMNQIKYSANSPEKVFLEYNLNNEHNLPWSNSHNIPFNPSLVNIIVPETGSMFSILGENRRVVLTFPPSYRGDEPFYRINCAHQEMAVDIRVLPYKEQPFRGLEKVFSDDDFKSLPRLRNMPKAEIIFPGDLKIIIPRSSLEYF